MICSRHVEPPNTNFCEWLYVHAEYFMCKKIISYVENGRDMYIFYAVHSLEHVFMV